MAHTQHPTRNDIPAAKRTQLIELLNQNLLNLIDLYGQTKFAHWNVRGPHFIAYHELFDMLAAGLPPLIDDTAERAAALGGVVNGTSRQVAAHSEVPEFPEGVHDGIAVVTALADRYAKAGASTRAAIDSADKLEDKDSADLFTGASRYLDKSLWFLEAHLSK